MERISNTLLGSLTRSAALAVSMAAAAMPACNDAPRAATPAFTGQAMAGGGAGATTGNSGGPAISAGSTGKLAEAPLDTGVMAGPPGASFWNIPEPPSPDAKAGDIRWVQQRSDAPPGSNGWNMVYVAEITEGVKKFVSGEIYVPTKPATGPRDVVLWNHETTGVADVCAPSRRDVREDGHERVPGLAELLGRGYVVVMSDYPGQGLPGPAFYMVGRVNARASLDALKAVQNFPLAAASKRFVMYGWSQGGQTTMWAETMAAAYAPGFTGLGAGLLAPAVRIRALTMNSMQDKMLAGYVISTLPGIKAAYPELKYSDFLTNEGLEQFPTMADGCSDVWQQASKLVAPYQANALMPMSPWYNAMTEVDNFAPAGTMPFVVYQGTADTTTPISLTDNEVKALCATNVDVENIIFNGADHIAAMIQGSMQFPTWAADRFAGTKAKTTCTAP